MSDIPSPRIGLHISSSRIGRSIMEIYKSLTDAWMRKLGLRPRYSFSGNICFEISVFCLCSVRRRPLPAVCDFTPVGIWSTYDVSVLKKRGGGMRTDRTPSKATITNKTRQAKSFSSWQPAGALCRAGVLCICLFSGTNRHDRNHAWQARKGLSLLTATWLRQTLLGNRDVMQYALL